MKIKIYNINRMFILLASLLFFLIVCPLVLYAEDNHKDSKFNVKPFIKWNSEFIYNCKKHKDNIICIGSPYDDKSIKVGIRISNSPIDNQTISQNGEPGVVGGKKVIWLFNPPEGALFPKDSVYRRTTLQYNSHDKLDTYWIVIWITTIDETDMDRVVEALKYFKLKRAP